mmetsp:Transcript_49127/g.97636  ORF Transcript_49127/g.97636 Transcript_49127/m.97636 type:complete len:243 (+) Transcript_49127:45-773(+)
MGNACSEGILKPKGQMKLQYFPISGRAEPIRLALMLGKFDVVDQRISSTQWEQKYKSQTPFGQVPVLTVNNKKIAQTKAILRFVGKMVKHEGRLLYPTDPLLALKVDEVMDAFDDLWILLGPTFRVADKEQKELARKELFAPEGPATFFVKIFEKMLTESTTGFVVPEAGLTVADLSYFCFLNLIRSGFVEGLAPDLFSGYPKIMEHKERVAKIPAIKEYYECPNKSNPDNSPFYEVFQPGK